MACRQLLAYNSATTPFFVGVHLPLFGTIKQGQTDCFMMMHRSALSPFAQIETRFTRVCAVLGQGVMKLFTPTTLVHTAHAATEGCEMFWARRSPKPENQDA
jgi:hypothetical protein